MGQLEANMGKRAVQLRKIFSDLGPSFIKVGQALSARPALLPQAYLEVGSQHPLGLSVPAPCPALHAEVKVEHHGLNCRQAMMFSGYESMHPLYQCIHVCFVWLGNIADIQE